MLKEFLIVIATNSLVSDTTAQKVSHAFFRCLKNGKVKSLAEILTNFRKNLKSLAQSTQNDHDDVFYFGEENEGQSEWFINYGGTTEPKGIFLNQ